MSAPETMMIDSIKYIRADSVQETEPQILSVDVAPWKIGAIYLIRTVTMIDTGKLVAVTSQELVLEDAAWIADSGRFSDALVTGNLNEVEPFPSGRVILGRGAIIDAVEWNHPLPRTKK